LEADTIIKVDTEYSFKRNKLNCGKVTLMNNLKDDVWFAGFVDGEGYFGIYEGNNRRTWTFHCGINLRLDDESILRKAMEVFGGSMHIDRREGGKLRYEGQGKVYEGECKPRWKWNVSARAEVLRLANYFEQYPLRSKKARDCNIWCEAAQLYYRYSVKGNNPDWLLKRIAIYKQEISNARRYRFDETYNLPLSFCRISDDQLSLVEV